MRIHSIAWAAIYVATCVGCSAELAQRAPASDPGNAAAAEAPYHAPPSYEPDPLLSPVPPKSAEPPPTGQEPAHSPTATPPGNPAMRGEPGGKPPAHPHDHGSMPGMQHGDGKPAHDHGSMPRMQHTDGKRSATVYTCPMHPEVRLPQPGKCPKCGMTLVPAEPKTNGQ